MDELEFAKLCIEYTETYRKLQTLEEEIKKEVLSMPTPSTQKVGALTATYRSPRRTYHYDKAWEKHGIKNPEALDEFTKTSTRVDYKAACEAYNITDIDWVEADPQVSIKVS